MMYTKIMKRTQIYLAPNQHDRLKNMALKKRSSVSEVIRGLIDEKLDATSLVSGKKPAYRSGGQWLLAQAKWAQKAGGSGPPDLAKNMDKYLYGN